jgi:hypothetical protein
MLLWDGKMQLAPANVRHRGPPLVCARLICGCVNPYSLRSSCCAKPLGSSWTRSKALLFAFPLVELFAFRLLRLFIGSESTFVVKKYRFCCRTGQLHCTPIPAVREILAQTAYGVGAEATTPRKSPKR